MKIILKLAELKNSLEKAHQIEHCDETVIQFEEGGEKYNLYMDFERNNIIMSTNLEEKFKRDSGLIYPFELRCETCRFKKNRKNHGVIFCTKLHKLFPSDYGCKYYIEDENTEN